MFGIGPHVALAVSESIHGTLDRIGIRGVWRLSKHLGCSVMFLESFLMGTLSCCGTEPLSGECLCHWEGWGGGRGGWGAWSTIMFRSMLCVK